MEEIEWYYTVGSEQQGPVSEAQLRDMIQKNQLESGAMVWRQGLAEWQKPDLLPELAASRLASFYLRPQGFGQP